MSDGNPERAAGGRQVVPRFPAAQGEHLDEVAAASFPLIEATANAINGVADWRDSFSHQAVDG